MAGICLASNWEIFAISAIEKSDCLSLFCISAVVVLKLWGFMELNKRNCGYKSLVIGVVVSGVITKHKGIQTDGIAIS